MNLRRSGEKQGTDITPVHYGNTQNRSTKVQMMHQEFSDLKKKLNEMESKNNKIMNRLHEAHKFKKKKIAYEEPPLDIDEEYGSNQQPMGSYNHKRYSEEKPLSEGIGKKMAKSRVSNNEHFDPSVDLRRNMTTYEEEGPNVHLDEYMKKRSQKYAYEDYGQLGQSYTQANNMSLHALNYPGQISPVHTFQNTQKGFPSQGYNQVSNPMIQSQTLESSGDKVKQLKKQLQATTEDKDKIEKELLLHLQQNRTLQAQIQLLQKGGTHPKEFNNVIEQELKQFMNGVIKRKMDEIEKYCRKNENKVKNVILAIKDGLEERKHRKMLEQGKKRRQSSSRRMIDQRDVVRDYSPGVEVTQLDTSSVLRNNNTISQRNMSPRGAHSKRALQPRSRSRDRAISRSRVKNTSELEKNNKGFEDIANKYQEIIKVKNTEFEEMEKQLRQKELTIHDLKEKLKVAEQQVASNENKMVYSSSSYDPNKRSMIDSAYLNEDASRLEIVHKEELQDMKRELFEREQRIELLENKIQEKNQKQVLMYEQYQQNITKNQELSKKKILDEFQSKISELELKLADSNKKLVDLEQESSQNEKKVMEKDYQVINLQAKISKFQQMEQMKNSKIEELEKLLRFENGNELLDKSEILESSMLQHEISRFRAETDQFERELLEKKNIILKYTEEKAKLEAIIEAKQLEWSQRELTYLGQLEDCGEKLRQLEKEEYIDSNSNEPEQQSILQEIEIERQELQQKVAETEQKYRQVLAKMKKVNQENITINSKCIKLESQLKYQKESQEDLVRKLAEIKEGFKRQKERISEFENELQAKDQEIYQLRQEKRNLTNQSQIKDQPNSHLIFESMHYSEQGESMDKGFSDKISVDLVQQRDLKVELELLQEKIKDQESLLQVQANMEERIIEEHKKNIETVKKDMQERGRKIEELTNQNDTLKRKVKQNQAKSNQIEVEDKAESAKRMEEELEEAHQDNRKLNELVEEMMGQLQSLESNRREIEEEYHAKDLKISDLEHLMQIKDIELQKLGSSSVYRSSINGVGISQRNSKLSNKEGAYRNSIQSQKSLPPSSLTGSNIWDRMPEREQCENVFEQSNYSITSDFNNVLNSSRISNLFHREPVFFQRVKMQKVDHSKFFDKVSKYIHSLQKSLQQKKTKIRCYEKKIESMKDSELVRKDIYMTPEEYPDQEEDEISTFKDYDSVDGRKSGNQQSYKSKYKRLEHDTKLIIQENKILANQIQILQDDLMKAEEQENVMIKVKDMYKYEIQSLMKKNTEQTKQYESEVLKHRALIEESESFHNLEAIRQLFIKIIHCVGGLYDDWGRRHKEKKKELDEFVKVMCNVLKYDQVLKEKIQASLQ